MALLHQVVQAKSRNRPERRRRRQQTLPERHGCKAEKRSRDSGGQQNIASLERQKE